MKRLTSRFMQMKIPISASPKMMDEELSVNERNRRNIFNVTQRRGQHHREYCGNLDDNGSSRYLAVSDGTPAARKLNSH